MATSPNPLTGVKVEASLTNRKLVINAVWKSVRLTHVLAQHYEK